MIAARALRFAYPPLAPTTEGRLLLDGLTIRIAAGERVALMGATGAGKTTLAQLLAGLAPTLTGGTLTGELTVAGQDLRAGLPDDFSARVGLLFQAAEQQLFSLTVADEVAFGLEGLGLGEREVAARTAWVLGRVGLAGLERRAPWQLSGGQQKRLALATVLAMRPPLLILDEPMAGLDPLGRRAVAALLDELKREGETTMLVIEQDAEWVARWAERLLLLHEGRIVADGPARALLSDVPLLRRTAIQPPQIAEIAEALALPGHPLTSTEAAPLVAPLLAARPRDPEALDEAPPPVAPPDGPPAVVATDLIYRYPDGPQALDGLSLTIPAGQFVALVGPNGGGKTTFAKHLNGLLRPARGSVTLFGQPTAGRGTGALARQVGYLFQNPDLQLFETTVRAELAFGLRALGLPEPTVQARIAAALARFALEPWAEAPPATLGYGLRRLVTLASTWAMQPPIWLLDEPTNGLDGRLTARLVEEMRALHGAGHTILLITHDMRLVGELAERMVVIAGGTVALDDSPRRLLAAAEPLRPFGLRPPAVTRLAGKLPPLPRDILTVEAFRQQVVR